MPKAEQEQPTTSQSGTRLPTFQSIEAAAEFWDTHSLAAFENELEEVKDVRFVVRRAGPKKAITVRLGQDTIDTLTKKAREQGVGLSTLARMWILEHLRETQPR